MAAYWTSFASNALSTAASVGTDMLPVIGLLAGIALAERVLRFVLNTSRG